MLIWHDSLGYKASAYFYAQYPGASGSPTFLNTHQDLGRYSMGGTFGIRTEPSLLPSPMEAICIFGIRIRSTVTGLAAGSLIQVMTSNNTSLQVQVNTVLTATGWYLEILRGTGQEILLRTPVVPVNQWVFLEVLVRTSISQGKIVVRYDGTEVARAENITTETGISDRYWDSVNLSIQTNGFRLSDFYLLDGREDSGKTFSTFLGPVTASKIQAARATRREWVNTVSSNQKTRLVVIAGQSNMEGRITAGSSPNWRNPNPVVEIWDRITGAAAFRPLHAPLNTGGSLSDPVAPMFSGPEMRMAERIAQFYESSGITTTPKVKIIKGAKDASYLFPWTANFCWNPSVVNNLYNGPGPAPRGNLLADIALAVFDLGGWGNIERVDFFWYQGESEALYDIASALYYGMLTNFFNTIRADIGGLAPLQFHVVRLHKDHERGLGPDMGGFWFVDRMRQVQKAFCERAADSKMLDIDKATIDGVGLHMQGDGYDTIGDIMFESWLAEQEFAAAISDYETQPTVDPYYIATDENSGARIDFSVSGRRQLGLSPVLSVAAHLHAQSPSSPWVSATPLCGPREFPPILADSASWKNFRKYSPGISLPELVGDSVGLTV